MSAPYPWLDASWASLTRRRATPPATLLLSGPRGIGKAALARQWGKLLLCEAPDPGETPCGSCAACHWFDAGTHPDWHVLTLQEKTSREGETRQATQIDIEQARAAIAFVQMSSYRGRRRVVLIEPADALNVAASNALLKVLEEPPMNAVFVLVAHQPRRLLPTVLSRCVHIEVGAPARDTARAWLVASGYGEIDRRLAVAATPLAAAELDEEVLALRTAFYALLTKPEMLEPVLASERLKALPMAVWYRLAYTWLADMLSVRWAGAVQFNADYADVLAGLARQAAPDRLLGLAREQGEWGRVLDHPLNRTLQLQAWLVRYQHLFRGTVAPTPAWP